MGKETLKKEIDLDAFLWRHTWHFPALLTDPKSLIIILVVETMVHQPIDHSEIQIKCINSFGSETKHRQQISTGSSNGF